MIQQFPKLRGFGKQLEKPLRRTGLDWDNGADPDQ
jgi:hypothetical protein